jgi:hypothetical protein
MDDGTEEIDAVEVAAGPPCPWLDQQEAWARQRLASRAVFPGRGLNPELACVSRQLENGRLCSFPQGWGCSSREGHLRRH